MSFIGQPSTQPFVSVQWWNLLGDDMVAWFKTAGWRIILIFWLLYMAHRYGRRIIDRAMRIALRGDRHDPIRDLGVAKRRNTLVSLFNGILSVVVLVIGASMIFKQIGLEIAPVIASAGVVGLAIGFGAQSLVRDILTGMFIILEQQFNVGDVVQIDAISGLVEEINLRTTVLRSLDGTVSIIPNGTITHVQVLTRDWSRLVLDVSVAYNFDLNKVFEVLMQVLNQYAEDHPDIAIDKPALLGVESTTDNTIVVRSILKTAPIRQWDCGRAVRKLVKEAFDRVGIAPFGR